MAVHLVWASCIVLSILIVTVGFYLGCTIDERTKRRVSLAEIRARRERVRLEQGVEMRKADLFEIMVTTKPQLLEEHLREIREQRGA